MTGTNRLPLRRRLYFEEFEPGQSAMSAGRTVTEADVVSFAAQAGDWTTIHTDAVYAARHPFGLRVAHGLLVLSIASGLCTRLGFLEGTDLAFRRIESWKFSAPVFLGDTVHVRITVEATRSQRRLQGGLVAFKVEVVNQHDQVVQRGTWELLIMSREKQVKSRG
ncbi:MaoC/PaaZ C-terminal domain-containing protein [Chloroflexota bacterium]